MNTRFKSIFKNTGIFLLGLVVGALLIESLEIYVRPIYRQLIGTDLKTEQDFLAGRSSRENKPLEETFHRWATVNAESDEGFRSFHANNGQIEDTSYLFPLALLGFKWMYSPDNIQRGKKIVEGLDRGKLAVALEKIGQQAEADKQWVKSQQLQQRPTLEAAKQLTHSILEQERTDVHQKAENSVLGKSNK
jgi:hypothetical protein